jgi:uncharacterized protein (TIGR02421 family)
MRINENRWMDIDGRFAQLQSDIDIDNYLAPINRANELEIFKQAVSRNTPYNPMFEYDVLPNVFESELIALRAELDSTDPIESIFISAINVRLGEIRAAQFHISEDISKHTIATYGRPDGAVLAAAHQNLLVTKGNQDAYHGKIEGSIYDAEQLADLCRKAMAQYGFDWKIVVKEEMGAKAAVDNLIKEFWIRADVKFHESLVKMMIVHEIGTHVLRSENGYAQPLKIFGRGLPAYQFTEEGLAEYAEERCGALLDDTVYRISGRVIGVEKALKGSFWDVFLALKPYFDIEMAFDIAQRAKLGLRDTAESGSYTKDYTYLAGLIRMREFFEHAPPGKIDALFAGKVGLHHLPVVAELQSVGYLLKPKSYPEWM